MIKYSDAEVILVDWISRNIISQISDTSIVRFLIAGFMPGAVRYYASKIKQIPFQDIIDIDDNININAFEKFCINGFATMEKFKIPGLEEMGCGQFYLNKLCCEDIISSLRAFEEN